MKTYFKSDEIAHIWAHKSAPEGNSPSAMSFNGDAFYSYGTVIARHITFRGQSAVILNESGYSSTTSEHQGIVGRSVACENVFRIGGRMRGDDLRPTGAQLFNYAIERAAKCQQQAKRARTRGPELLGAAAQWLRRAQKVAEFFGIRRRVDQETIDNFEAQCAREEKARLKKESTRQAKERAEQQEGFTAWLEGRDGPPFSRSLFPVSFRVEGKELVSTYGARVPLKDARLAYRFATSRRAQGWHANGETCPVGNYCLDAINAQGIVAGCHRISWDEVERLAPILGK